MHHYIQRIEISHPALCVGCSLLSLALGSGVAVGGPIYPQPLNKVGDSPTRIKSVDVNNDGFPDIVTMNKGGNTVSVLIGNGDGTYQDQYGFFAGLGLVDMELADFDEDGDPDLVTLSSQSQEVHIFENPGDGRFTNRMSVDVNEFFDFNDLYDIAIVDVFSDGRPDIVIPIEGMGATLIENIGGLDFATQYYFDQVPGSSCTHLVQLDLDLDGDLDFVGAEVSGGIEIYVNLGGDEYVDLDFVGLGIDIDAILPADFNGDGYPDLLIAPATDELFFNFDECAVLLNDQSGRFDTELYLDAQNEIAGVTATDIDLDGDLDVVVSHRFDTFDGSLSVFLRNENMDPDFEFFDDPYMVMYSGSPQSIVFDDVDLDGDDDLVAAHRNSRAGVLIANGDGTFVLPDQVQSDLTTGDIIAWDVDLDGDDDLVSAASATGELLVGLSNGDGTFADTIRFPAGLETRLVLAADFDGDGYDDALVRNEGTTYSTMLSGGDGTFGAPTDSDLLTSYSILHAVDFDGDGTPDLLGQSGNSVMLHVGDGLGGFGSAAEVLIADDIEQFLIGDVNADGLEDVIVLGRQDEFSRFAQTYLSNGDGTLALGLTQQIGLYAIDAQLGDLDLDGDLDLISLHPASDDARVHINEGNGGFAPPVRFNVSDEPFFMELMDYDHDGDLDLVTLNENHLDVTILKNDGNANFSQKAFFLGYGEERANAIVVGDVDGNGGQDLLFPIGSSFVIYLEQSSGQGGCPVDLNNDGELNFFDVSAFLVAFAAEDPIADFNNDGMFNFFDVGPFLEAFNAGCP